MSKSEIALGGVAEVVGEEPIIDDVPAGLEPGSEGAMVAIPNIVAQQF